MKPCDRCEKEFNSDVPTIEELTDGTYEFKFEKRQKQIKTIAKEFMKFKPRKNVRLCPKCLKEEYEEIRK
jgi:hypothetical protein